MNKKLIGLLFTFACIFNYESAHALLWDLSPGTINYTRTPNGGTGWQVTMTVADSNENIIINGHTYLHIYQNNYDNNNGYENFYFYINDTQLWTSGGSTEELLFDTSKQIGESWTRSGGDETITMRGFDSAIGAYFVEINRTNTPSWYEYLVPQLGIVMEVDYYVGQNAPYVMKRDDWNQTPVPEPTTMILFGTGIAGLAAVGRRRRS